MCGIAGIIARRASYRVDLRDLEALRDSQRHRGPDDAGVWLSADHRVGLGHRRLSIIDLSPRGRQPMSTPDGSLTITFNGEIYNHHELRRQLVGEGVQFRSESDTEVILLGYRQWGSTVVDRLRGMFAFAIWDDSRRELFLARDPLGIKPLYFAEDDGRFVFASEVRALRSVMDLGELDARALTDFLHWGSISSPITLYSRAHSLEPGHWLRLPETGDREDVAYSRLEEAFGEKVEVGAEAGFELIAEALRDSVRHHLIADVPVGAFLSGGVDSVSLVALLSEIHGGPIDTVTIASDDPDLDESRLAAFAARFYGTRHHEIHLNIEDIRGRMPQAISSMDQPTIDGINTYLVSEAARQVGLKVAISGVGGDELFGGYPTFRQVPQILSINQMIRALPGGRSAIKGAAKLLGSSRSPRPVAKLARALEHGATAEGAYYSCRGLFSPVEIRALLSPEFSREAEDLDPSHRLATSIALEGVSAEDRVSALEIRQYLQSQLLRDTDAASMAHGLEVRTPLVDRTLLSAVARIPAEHRLARPAKRALREAPTRPVPPEIWNRKKQGFTIPFDRWIRSGRLDLPLPTHPALNRDSIDMIAKRFRAGNIHWSRIWALMVLGQFLGDS
ncbi:asparagine synthase (glutamine-hydrolyzing) [Myxococcota bacterium]|nr:asparagine synthase (glutamine-hydrolyzing) [Myxococcota bacterium]